MSPTPPGGPPVGSLPLIHLLSICILTSSLRFMNMNKIENINEKPFYFKPEHSRGLNNTLNLGETASSAVSPGAGSSITESCMSLAAGQSSTASNTSMASSPGPCHSVSSLSSNIIKGRLAFCLIVIFILLYFYVKKIHVQVEFSKNTLKPSSP